MSSFGDGSYLEFGGNRGGLVEFGDDKATFGVYTGTYTLDKSPKRNRVDIEANVVDKATSESYTAFNDMYIYGVEVDLPEKELFVTVSPTGRVQKETRIDYTIMPDRSIQPYYPYIASSAHVFIYEKGNENPFTTIVSERTGTDFVTLAEGFEFDLAKEYYAQVVLNHGFGMEIRSERVILKLVEASLFPDYDHNRKIDARDVARAENEDTFYFWINDDDDEGEVAAGHTDIPGQPFEEGGRLDFEAPSVDGVRDLIDFFPVYMGIGNILDKFDTDDHTYWLKATDDSMNVVFTNLSGENAGDYLTAAKNELVVIASGMGYGFKLPGNTITYPIPAEGINLTTDSVGSEFLQLISEGRSGAVILLEGRTVGEAQLTLEVIRDADKELVYKDSLPVKLSGVEDMFRHKNFTKDVTAHSEIYDNDDRGNDYDVGSNTGMIDRLGTPSNFPASETNEKNFIFLHGANVNGNQARGWQSEIFKRMYWSGSRAKFWGITWYGWHTQKASIRFTPHYHLNVIHALDTSKKLADFLNDHNYVEGEKTVAGHSLGNMVISNALSYEGLSANNYFMVNAAVATEAYGAANVNEKMTNPEWYGYDPKLRASEWHNLFVNDEPSDERAKMTWRSYFADKHGTKYYNFWSEGEEVLKDHSGSIYDGLLENVKITGINAWALQEKLKGRMPEGFNWLVGSDYGGWGFNLNEHQYRLSEFLDDPILPDEANQLLNVHLRTKPFFKVSSKNSGLFDEAGGSVFAKANKRRFLAEMIPAMTLAAGKNEVGADDFIAEFDMQSQFKTEVNKTPIWPSAREDEPFWLHSDIREVSYLYVHKLFNEFVEIGGLNK